MENSQAGIEDLKAIVAKVNFKQEATNTSREPTDLELKACNAAILDLNVTIEEVI